MRSVVLALMVALSIGLGMPATCDDGQSPALEVKSGDSTAAKSDSEKKAEDKKADEKRPEDRKRDDDKDRKEKIRLEREARKEAERRERRDRRRQPRGDGGVIIVSDGGGESVEGTSRPWQGFTAGVVYAPGSGGSKPALGLQYIGDRGWGASLWLSGDPDAGDLIDAAIPHDDYYVDRVNSSYGAQVLYRAGSDEASLILGAGLAIEQVQYVDVSNVTGWQWDGGTDTAIKPAAQIGCRLRLGRTVGLNLGYDTHQHAFFGLSAGF